MTIQEGAIRIQIPANCKARRFDGPDHRMEHAMKAVDFIIDTPSARIFLEVKDPDAAKKPDTSKSYIQRLKAEQVDTELIYKYRDSWIYLYASKKIRKSPCYYFVLLGLETISTESMMTRRDALRRRTSLEGPDGIWTKPFVDQILVFNLESWNRSFPQFEAIRI